MVCAMVAPLVGSVLGAVTNNVVAVVLKLAGKSYELWSDFDNDIESIKRDLLMIAGMENELSGLDDLSAVLTISSEEMHELAIEIEDLLDRIQRYSVERKDGLLLHAVLGFASGLLLEAKVKTLKERLNAAYQRKSNSNGSVHQQSLSWTPPGNTYTTNIGPVGIEEPKSEICQWMMKDVGGQPEQLRVISILGFSGSGKSTLAKAVYDCPDVASQFHYRVWVVASKHGDNTNGLLIELFEKLGQGDQISDTGDVEQLKAKISNNLKDAKRYLIVLDDIKNQTWWDGIKSAFPENVTGRIIVTTTIQKVAKVCSRRNGYVHSMAALDGKHSKELLKAVLKGYSPGLERSSTTITNKCGGHPHALVTVANYLQSEDVITETVCKQLCQNLGFRMATEDAFKELQNVLMGNYKSLPKDFPNIKTCLLYVCVFPNGCNIRRSRLMRRWFAEGYVQHDHARSTIVVADDNFKKLVDQSIISPIDTSKNAVVKTCRAHGIFHEFLLHMSMSAKFITPFDNPERRNYRHLFIQNGSSGRASYTSGHQTNPVHEDESEDDEEKTPRAHSLTICGSAGKAVGYFAKCELLRVLDLEECKDLEDKHLDGIHKLWYLKYLSVGDTISRLPKDIEKLHGLETLDMRKTKEDVTLPVEVINLRHLAHLLGRFKLDKRDWEKTKPENYVPEKSNLQTLAGFVTDNNPGFAKLMLYMKQLRKVKIWRNSTGEGSDDIMRAIESFVQAELDTGVGVRSLSLDIGNSSGLILRSLEYGYLSSLKLHGELRGLVQFVRMLFTLKELCLSSTNDLTEDDLSEIRKIVTLVFLKLVGVSLGGFVIKREDLPELERLCFVQCPSLPTVKEGALPNLLSLRLLNQDLDGLSGIKTNQHKLLNEIALDSDVDMKTKNDWGDAAKNHPKKPRILFFKRIDPDETGSMVKYVPEMEPSIAGRKRNIHAVQQDPMDIDCDSKQMKFSEPSPASTELPNGRDELMLPSSSADPYSGANTLCIQ